MLAHLFGDAPVGCFMRTAYAAQAGMHQPNGVQLNVPQTNHKLYSCYEN